MDVTAALYTIQKWFPEGRSREAIARLVADSIRFAHASAPASWELTLRPDFARLNVGQVAVLDLFPGEVALYASKTRLRSSTGRRREDSWQQYNAVPGKHERWLLDPGVVVSLPAELLTAHRSLVEAAFTSKRGSPHRAAHTPGAVDAIAALSGFALEQPTYFVEPTIAESEPAARNAFGNPATNPIVEAAAVDAVRAYYESKGWAVASRERDRCGYDLDCTKGRQVRHVEVKGRSGSDVAFVMTSKELEFANANQRFQLAVVTQACVNPQLHFFDTETFGRDFVATPISYVVRYNPSRSASQRSLQPTSDLRIANASHSLLFGSLAAELGR